MTEICARGGIRTHTDFCPRDFKSLVSRTTIAFATKAIKE